MNKLEIDTSSAKTAFNLLDYRKEGLLDVEEVQEIGSVDVAADEDVIVDSEVKEEVIREKQILLI